MPISVKTGVYRLLTKEERDAALAADPYYNEIRQAMADLDVLITAQQQVLRDVHNARQKAEKKMKILLFKRLKRKAQSQTVRGQILERLSWHKIKETRIKLGLI